MQPKDYNDSRYDRGHMAAAADFSHDTQLWESTFTMANISPQVVYYILNLVGFCECLLCGVAGTAVEQRLLGEI